MKVLELFAGTQSISKAFRAAGHECFTIDFDPTTAPDWCMDLLYWDIKKQPLEWRKPDIIWASPPCTSFSVASFSHYWLPGIRPKNSGCYVGMALALKSIEIIKELNPKYFFIENPRGLLRKMWFMQGLPRHTITYCRYGAAYQKPTDIWSNAPWISRKPCRPGDSCHPPQPRGYRAKKDFLCLGSGVQGLSGGKERGIIPPELCREIVEACEGRQPERQDAL